MTALQHEVRRLLLPVVPGNEEASVAAVGDRLNDLGIVGSDQAERVRQLAERWRESGAEMGPELRDIARRAIRAGFPEAPKAFSTGYHALHAKLQRQHVMSFEAASALLSQAPTVRQLAVEQRFSASAIAKVLGARGTVVDAPWGGVAALLGSLGAKPALRIGRPGEPGTIEGVLSDDGSQKDDRFLDADIGTGAAIVGEVGERLGFGGGLSDLLTTLCQPDGQTFAPYLQVLHFQCVVAALYDHPVTMPYEFNPRGAKAAFLLPTYEPLTHTLSAFLNNMKAIERLDSAWARARTAERSRAHALVGVLQGLEAMAFLARKELATWIRQWLLRVVDQAAPAPNPVPARATTATVQRAMSALVASPGGTRTGGVLEQRIVDALSSTIHMEVDGWRSRGLGLPVNANNLSSRRLGDCDFQHPALGGHEPRIAAYEATAGRLTRTYLEGHLQTLRRSMSARVGELDGIADRTSWRVALVFVAHEFASDLPSSGPLPVDDYCGVAVETDYVTYAELRDRANEAQLIDAFTTHVHARLNEVRTPRAARSKFLEMLT